MEKKTMNAVYPEHIKGKTVAGSGYWGGRLLIVFTDDSCIALEASDDDGLEIGFEQDDELNLLTPVWAINALRAKAISKDEYESVCAEQREVEIERARNQLKWLESQKQPTPAE